MEIEAHRQRTFERTNVGPFDHIILARTGIYIQTTIHNTRYPVCYFCKTTIDKWYNYHDEVEFHRQLSPHCPLINGSINHKRTNTFIPTTTRNPTHDIITRKGSTYNKPTKQLLSIRSQRSMA